MSTVGTFEPIFQHSESVPFNFTFLSPQVAPRTAIWHDGYRLFYVNTGHLNLKANGQIKRYSAGQFALIKPYTSYQLLNYSGKVLTLAFPRVCVRKAIQPTQTVIVAPRLGLHSLLQEVTNLLLHPTAGAPQRFHELGNLLLQQLVKLEEAVFKAPSRAIERVLIYLQLHYADRVTYQQLAKVAGMPLNRFMVEFDRATQKSPALVLREVRLAKAKQILADAGEEPSLVAVVRQTGYSNVSDFNRDFKRTEGLTASQWRLKYQGTLW